MGKRRPGKIELAIEVALNAHQGQIDKAGQPYILHPLRLLQKFNSEEEQIVCILHDVVEDSAITLLELEQFDFDPAIVEAVDCLSKRSGEEYEVFISRLASNTLARMVKIEVLKDNLNICRLPQIDEKDLSRVVKYHAALRFLVEYK